MPTAWGFRHPLVSAVRQPTGDPESDRLAIYDRRRFPVSRILDRIAGRILGKNLALLAVRPQEVRGPHFHLASRARSAYPRLAGFSSFGDAFQRNVQSGCATDQELHFPNAAGQAVQNHAYREAQRSQQNQGHREDGQGDAQHKSCAQILQHHPYRRG